MERRRLQSSRIGFRKATGLPRSSTDSGLVPESALSIAAQSYRRGKPIRRGDLCLSSMFPKTRARASRFAAQCHGLGFRLKKLRESCKKRAREILAAGDRDDEAQGRVRFGEAADFVIGEAG